VEPPFHHGENDEPRFNFTGCHRFGHGDGIQTHQPYLHFGVAAVETLDEVGKIVVRPVPQDTEGADAAFQFGSRCAMVRLDVRLGHATD
jgi:hypothetical protein